ncbi:hypothetical protein DVW14_15680, partial [Enterococcus faecium]
MFTASDNDIYDLFEQSGPSMSSALEEMTPTTIIYNEMVTQDYYSRVLAGWNRFLTAEDTKRTKMERSIVDQYNQQKQAQVQAQLDSMGSPRFT